MKVKFTKDVTTKTRPEDQESYKTGEIHDLSDASAQHWINRGVAVAVSEEEARPSRPAVRPGPPRPPEPPK